MKKRSMLAIASLATGFVVAAVTPSHGLDTHALGTPNADDTLSTLDRATTDVSPALGEKTPGQGGHGGHAGGGGTSRNG
jgi:hypothetical protein